MGVQDIPESNDWKRKDEKQGVGMGHWLGYKIDRSKRAASVEVLPSGIWRRICLMVCLMLQVGRKERMLGMGMPVVAKKSRNHFNFNSNSIQLSDNWPHNLLLPWEQRM